MKVITKVREITIIYFCSLSLSVKTAYSRIVDEDGCSLEPRLSTADVCPQCVERMFKGVSTMRHIFMIHQDD